MKRSIRALFVCTLALAVVAAPALAAPVRVRATSNDTWSPVLQYSARGQRVVWTNPTTRSHTVTSYGSNWAKNVVIQPGERTRKVFRRTGLFRYRCTLHSHLDGTDCHGMCGRIRVR